MEEGGDMMKKVEKFCRNSYFSFFYHEFFITTPCLKYKYFYSSISQCTTQRVYSNQDLFEILTSMNIARDHHNRIISVIGQTTRFICMFTRMTWLFHKEIVLQIIKSHPPIIERDHPWTRFVLLDSSARPVPSSPKTKTPYL